MSRPLFKATIRATGKEIEVYRQLSAIDSWIDFADCETTYFTKELVLPEEATNPNFKKKR